MTFFLSFTYIREPAASEVYKRITAKNSCEKPPWVDCCITHALQVVFLHTLLRVLDKGKLVPHFICNFTHFHIMLISNNIKVYI